VDRWLAAAVALAALAVYVRTLHRTVPFWDAGEFIASAYGLGIPHPPGTPLYVLLGRVFCLLPLPVSIAERVNLLSAIPAAIAVGLTFLVTVRLATDLGAPFARTGERGSEPTWLARFGAVVAALVVAFSDTFWMNAIEAEVYALSSMVMIGVVFLLLLWRDRRHRAGEAADGNLVVVSFYFLALSIAFHMGTFIVFLPLVLFFLAEHHPSLHSPRFVSSAFLLVTLLFFMGFGPAQLGISALLVSCLLVANAPLVRSAFASSNGWRGNLALWLAFVFVLGLSVHAFLPIRAALDPPINEADPSSLERFWLVLSRDQYKPGPPWELRASWEARLGTQFWRYFRTQYDAGASFALGSTGARFDAWAFPFALGLLGAIAQAARARRAFLLCAFLVFACSIGLVWHLNFRAEEVRDRDYFFVGLYQFFALWIGLGAAWVVAFVREAVRGKASRPLAVAAALAFAAQPVGQLRAGFWKHDRSRDTIAREFAVNMLVPLEENAILFTNGDNDTFPLWYLQEVEGVRKDVRVLNLSLLNTDWYLRQLRDLPPEVPLSWSDATIGSLEAVWDERTQKVVEVKDMAVVEILRANHGERPTYIAVTVPDLMGLDEAKRVVNEGLVWRVSEEPVAADVDAERLRRNLEDVFEFDGLLDDRGGLDSTRYRDRNEIHLVQNYAAAWQRLALVHEDRARESARAGRQEEGIAETNRAIEALERASVFRAGFSLADVVLATMYQAVGRIDVADSTLTRAIAIAASAEATAGYVPELHLRRGEVRFDAGALDEALADYAVFARAYPGEWIGWEARARALATAGKTQEALAVLDAWLATNPSHALGLEMKKLIAAGEYGPPENERN